MIGWGLMSQANIPVSGLPLILHRLPWVGLTGPVSLG